MHRSRSSNTVHYESSKKFESEIIKIPYRFKGVWKNGTQTVKGIHYDEDGKEITDKEEESEVEEEVEEIKIRKGVLLYSGGSKKYKGSLKGDLPHGKGVWYFKNGKIKYKGRLKEGNPHGKGVWYNKDGSIKHKGRFEEGAPVD